MKLGRSAAFVVTWGLAAGSATAAAPDDGRALYHGLVPFRPGVATLPAPFNACARCHGGSGEGGREGGLEAPALTWAALMAPRHGVSPFDGEAAVLRAMRDGEGRAGTVLATAMPRYKLDAEDAAALLAYLHRLATPDDLPLGVGRDRIELGTLLPVSGAAGATGRAVLAGLGDSLDAANRDGGVFGRRLDLQVFDTANGAEAAARELRAEPIFAVVGGLWTERGAVDAALADHHVGVVAPLVPRDAPAPNDRGAVELLPTRMAQEKALTEAVLACPAETRWSLRLASADPPDSPGRIRWFADPDQLRSALRASPEGGCLGLDLATAAVLRSDIPAAWRQRVSSRSSSCPAPARNSTRGRSSQPRPAWMASSLRACRRSTPGRDASRAGPPRWSMFRPRLAQVRRTP